MPWSRLECSWKWTGLSEHGQLSVAQPRCGWSWQQPKRLHSSVLFLRHAGAPLFWVERGVNGSEQLLHIVPIAIRSPRGCWASALCTSGGTFPHAVDHDCVTAGPRSHSTTLIISYCFWRTGWSVYFTALEEIKQTHFARFVTSDQVKKNINLL